MFPQREWNIYGFARFHWMDHVAIVAQPRHGIEGDVHIYDAQSLPDRKTVRHLGLTHRFFVQAVVHHHRYKSVIEQKEMTDRDDMVCLAESLTRHTHIHKARIFPQLRRIDAYYYASHLQQRRWIRQSGRVLPAPFKRH